MNDALLDALAEVTNNASLPFIRYEWSIPFDLQLYDYLGLDWPENDKMKFKDLYEWRMANYPSNIK